MDRGAVTVLVELAGEIGSAGVLPDNGVCVRLSGVTIPHHGGLTLVRDPHRREVGGSDACSVQTAANGSPGVGPDLGRVMFDPAGPRQDLFVFELVSTDLGALMVEHHEPGARGALVDRSDVRHGDTVGRVLDTVGIMRLLLIRHGQTQANVDGILESRIPGPGLTKLGLEQAAALPTTLAEVPIDAIHVSTMVRTHLTATPLAQARGLALLERDGLREVASGDYEQHTVEQSAALYLERVFAWADGDLDPRIPGGEDGHEVIGRFDEVVAEAESSGHETVALVSHGAMIRTWAGYRTENLDGRFVAENAVTNTGIVVVEGSSSSGWWTTNWLGTALTSASPTG